MPFRLEKSHQSARVEAEKAINPASATWPEAGLSRYEIAAEVAIINNISERRSESASRFLKAKSKPMSVNAIKGVIFGPNQAAARFAVTMAVI